MEWGKQRKKHVKISKGKENYTEMKVVGLKQEQANCSP